MRRAGVLGVAVLLVAAGVRADPRSLTYRYSEYEELAIHDAEAELQTALDPSPEGKTIERIDFVRLDPIDRHDPLPTAIDVVHTTSRAKVLRREILVKEGDPWKGVLVDESARNLRTLPQLSLVLCVPMRGRAAGGVRLVVITKDVWSLYVDVDIAATSGGIEQLDLEPKETNVAGLHHTALGRFVLEPATYSLGASYEIPRLEGRWLDLLVDGNAIINRASGVVEGSYGTASITRPLYSAHTEWAWSTGVTWNDRIYRRYVDAKETFYDSTPGATCAASDPACVPWRWRERTIVEQAKVTRSFGWEIKNDFSLGASLSHASYRVPEAPSIDHGQACDALVRGLSPLESASVYKFICANLPQGEDRAGPILQWHGYSSDFQRVLDFDTLGLQEDYRTGHDLWLRAYPVLRALGATRDFLGTYAAAAYGVALGDGLLRAAA
jgi:hypothetical protein